MPKTTNHPLNFWNLDWGNWLYGIFAGFIGGGAGAVVSGCVVAFKDPKDYAFGSWNFLQLIGMVFVVNGAVSMMMYLNRQPLPDIITETTETTLRIDDRPVMQTTKVVQTKTEASGTGDGSLTGTGDGGKV